MSFDASVLIGFLRPDDAHHERALRTFAAHRADAKVIAASVFSEVLVGPAKAGRTGEIEDFLSKLAAEIVPIDRAVALHAAELRARHRALALPDAMALAVARRRKIPFVTFDDRLARLA